MQRCPKALEYVIILAQLYKSIISEPLKPNALTSNTFDSLFKSIPLLTSNNQTEDYSSLDLLSFKPETKFVFWLALISSE